jgi:hypothetical protein
MVKKALVLGATGGMGSALVRELAERRIDVIAFSRNQEKLEKLYAHEEFITIYAGDVMNKEDLKQAAAAEVELIFHAVNLPYPQWAKKQPALLQNILETAKLHQTKVAMVDNIYAYGKSRGLYVTESLRKIPIRKKERFAYNLRTWPRDMECPFPSPTFLIFMDLMRKIRCFIIFFEPSFRINVQCLLVISKLQENTSIRQMEPRPWLNWLLTTKLTATIGISQVQV